MKPLQHARLWLLLFAIGIVATIISCMVPASALPETPAGGDKLEHWLVYAGLATAAVQLFPRPRALATSAVGLLALGIAIEFAQALLTTTRSGDVWDAAADALGILFGMATALTPWRDALLRVDRARAKNAIE